jgi:ComF family protein
METENLKQNISTFKISQFTPIFKYPYIGPVLSFFNDISEFFFPRYCISCDGKLFSDEKALCDECFELLQGIYEPICKVCGAPLKKRIKDEKCLLCPQSPINFDSARALFLFNGAAGDLIKSVKYSKRQDAAKLVGKMMASCLLSEFKNIKFDAIIPVPIHRYRMMTRGFNQAEVLSYIISKYSNIPVIDNILIRRTPTKKQSMLDYSDRAKNVRNAFRIVQPRYVRNMNILIVDDIITTGSTTNECAKEIKKAGAKSAYVLTFTRAVSM